MSPSVPLRQASPPCFTTASAFWAAVLLFKSASVWREQDSGEYGILVFYNELHCRFERRQ